MDGIHYWLNWTPLERKTNEPLGKEPTKLPNPVSESDFVGFVSDFSAGPPNLSPRGMADHDPEEWRDEFHLWVKERCVRRQDYDDWGGIGALLIDFGEWLVNHRSVPSPRTVFERLLLDAGHHVANGMVSKLILKVDLRQYQQMRERTKKKKSTPN